MSQINDLFYAYVVDGVVQGLRQAHSRQLPPLRPAYASLRPREDDHHEEVVWVPPGLLPDVGWSYDVANGFTPPPGKEPTLARRAQAILSAGITIDFRRILKRWPVTIPLTPEIYKEAEAYRKYLLEIDYARAELKIDKKTFDKESFQFRDIHNMPYPVPPHEFIAIWGPLAAIFEQAMFVTFGLSEVLPPSEVIVLLS